MKDILILAPDRPQFDLRDILAGGGYNARAERLGETDGGTTGAGAALIVVDMRRAGVDLRALKRPLGEVGPPLLAAINSDLLTDEGLELADDIIVEPFSDDELLARVRLLLLRAEDEASPGSLRRGDLIIDVANYRVTLNRELVELTFKEYELLKFLATNDGKVFTREALLSRVWGYNYYGGARTVDVHIRRIRSKIEVGGRAYIETVRNVGYRFSAL